jgi:ABC-type bacteriocin/lantibiotic exporter with double-glycine peptidase domain
VNRAIETLGLTRVIVAHRPETISSARRCLVMSEGTVRELPVRRTADERNTVPDVSCVTPINLHAAVA